VTPLRIGLAIAGFAAAVLAVILDQPRVVWGAIALLTAPLSCVSSSAGIDGV
jgi:hypothetical protein